MDKNSLTMMGKSASKDNRICFICDTPYQLLNILNYVCHQDKHTVEERDLLICNRDITEQQIDAVKGLSLFCHVYVYHTDLESAKQKKNILYRAQRFFLPKKFISSLITEPFDCRKYGMLFCAFPIPMAVAITSINPDIRLCLFDDGIGTYINGIPSPDSRKRQMLFRLKGKTSPWSRIETIYVNNKTQFRENKIAKKIEQLTPMGETSEFFQKAVEAIFPYRECSLYDQHNIIYLTQPLNTIIDEPELYWTIEEDILAGLNEIKLPVVIRKHPKHNSYINKVFPEDMSNDLWELICARQITDNHVLISGYSTAQFSPKFLYNKEPWLIFIFKLYTGFFNDQKIESMQEVIERIRNGYENKEKLLIPKNVEELKEALVKIDHIQKKEV